MEMDAIRDQLNEIFRRVFEDAAIEVRPDMTAADVELWTSLTHMEMMHGVEVAFGIKFKLQEINNPRKMRNVGDLMDLIAKKKAD